MFDKKRIVYVCKFNSDTYIITNSKPVAVYIDCFNNDGSIWARKIVSNQETWINDKPWWEVHNVSEVKHTLDIENCHPNYKIENKLYFDPNESTHYEDKDWILNKLKTKELVVVSDKNCFYIDNRVEKTNEGFLCTDRFSCCDGSWYHNSPARAVKFYRHEYFSNYEDCAKDIFYRIKKIKWICSYSDEEYSLLEACHYLKQKGYSARQRHDYLEVIKQLDNVGDVEVFVRNNKVYVNHQKTGKVLMEKPKLTKDIKNSPKKYRMWVEECNRIDNKINWYVDKMEITI